MRILMVTSFPIPGDYDGTAMLPIKILRAQAPRSRCRACLSEGEADLGRCNDPKRIRKHPSLSSSSHRLGMWSGVGNDRAKIPVRPRSRPALRRRNPARIRRVGAMAGRWSTKFTRSSVTKSSVVELGRGLVFQAYRYLEKRVLEHAAAVIALGEPVREVVTTERGVPADRVSVIYPGIDLAEYDVPTAPAEIAGVGPDDQVVMYIGSIVHPNQGVPILIDALPRVFAALPAARCVLVGGPAGAGTAYQARLGAMGDRLIVLPGCTPDQVVSLSRRANVLVHPRLACRENYSVQSKIAVYLAAGRPIVATDFGDYQRLLGASGAGLLTSALPEPLADAIIAVLKDRRLAARLAAATSAVAREFFAMDRNIDRYLEVYQRAIVAGPR